MAKSTTTYDIFVIGGGINGCGIARDAAGRGYSVCLAEMNDLASGTSSWSTKLIHGGLRYLEFFEFRLVREALVEREVLWRMAPHIIWPLRFVLPLQRGLRPPWMIRLGLFIYDHLGGRKALAPTRTLDLRRDPAGQPLKSRFKRAFEYADCWVDDARLVVLNARDAAERGAVISSRTEVVRAGHDGSSWKVRTRDRVSGAEEEVRARILVNAAGPWVDRVLTLFAERDNTRKVRLVQGSHIVVPKLFEHERCYFLQNTDDRVIFAIPYERDFTLIGTTDRDYSGDPKEAQISDEEVRYLCEAASAYFEEPVRPEDVVWTYSGVRPLYDDGASKAQEATRDYVIESSGTLDDACAISIFGGKITTYRRLAEEVMERVNDVFGKDRPAWTAQSSLPGGDFAATAYDDLVASLQADKPFLSERLARRLVRQYGTEARVIVAKASAPEELGECFGADLHACEVDHLVEREWARTAEDVLWRRTKLGLLFGAEEIERLDDYLASRASMQNA